MSAGKCLADFRVSTIRQGDFGLSLEAHKSAVQPFLQGGTWNLLADFTEIESGKLDRRPKLQEALRLCRVTGSKLVVAK